MKAIQRFQQGKEKREIKYAEFQAFFNGAESLFAAFFNKDYGVSSPVKIAIQPGGRMGGKDKRLIEIFYGLVPYENIDYEDRRLAKDAAFEGSRTLLEAGSRLVYQRADTGDVFCILHPATTDESKADVDMVLLDIVRRPCKLNALAYSHWQDLLAYNECTSINGSPSTCQKLRCFYLRHICKYSKNQKFQPAKAPNWMRQLFVITASVTFGGLFTTTIDKHLFADAQQGQASAPGARSKSATGNCQPILPPRSNLDSSMLRGRSAKP